MKLNRKEFLKLGAAASTATVLPVGATGSSAEAAAGLPQPPNILVLMSDQHRPDLLTCAGEGLVPTPNIDRIAGRGVRLSRAYCPYPVCGPSRMSFLTGLYPHNHGVVINNQVLDYGSPTIASHFRELGYLTGLVGKMHFADPFNYGFEYRVSINDWIMDLGPDVQNYANEIASDPAFATFESMVDSGSGLPILPHLWKEGSPWVGHVQPMNRIASEIPAERHLEAFIARESCRFMRRCKEINRPFFLVSGFVKPHAPFYPPRGWAEELYDPVSTPLREAGDPSTFPEYIQERIRRYRAMGERRLRFRRAGYLGNVAFMDHCVGQIYDCLEEMGLADNTIVVYTSDHGEMDSQHGLFQKFLFFEPSAGVPLIVSFPGVLPQGRVSDALVDYTGLFPTLVDLTGGAISGSVDVSSFLPYLRDPERKGPESVFSEYALSWAPRYMVRTDRYKYIFNEGTMNELYDLEADPLESRNLIGDSSYSGHRAQLQERLFAWYDPASNPFRPSTLRTAAYGYPPAEIRYPPGYKP